MQSTILSMGLLFFTACGDSNKKTLINKNLMITACTTGEFVTLYKDDKVTVLSENTELNIIHSEDGTKKACALTGSAKIN